MNLRVHVINQPPGNVYGHFMLNIRLSWTQIYVGDVQVIKVDATIDRFITEGKTEGFLKVVLDKNDRIVGADAIGAQAGEWIQLITLAIKQNLTPKDFSETIVAYPTHADIVRKAFNNFLVTKIAS